MRAIKKLVSRFCDKMARTIASEISIQCSSSKRDPITLVKEEACRESAEFIKMHLSTSMLFNSGDQFYNYVFQRIRQGGLFLEFGVFKGDSINWFASLFPDRTIHGFDSFEGLPGDWTGTSITGGGYFDRGGALPQVASNVQLHKGWFSDSLALFISEHKNEKIDFMFVDCDLYSSTKDVFDNIGDGIAAGTIIVLDEVVGNPGWQHHVIKAFDEYCEKNKVKYHFIAFFDWKGAVVIDSVD